MIRSTNRRALRTRAGGEWLQGRKEPGQTAHVVGGRVALGSQTGASRAGSPSPSQQNGTPFKWPSFRWPWQAEQEQPFSNGAGTGVVASPTPLPSLKPHHPQSKSDVASGYNGVVRGSAGRSPTGGGGGVMAGDTSDARSQTRPLSDHERNMVGGLVTRLMTSQPQPVNKS